ncbi:MULTISPECIES: hypothetical protein [Pseudomonas]|uniref:Uncharacterized protein n=1 Tax=Pseudomonas putida S13.1.2 TaxID=1384061 RepID=A0AAU8RTD2_PSEPU|nr:MULTISPECIES: hypothetical protein [Pseudomonas]AJQ46192.1 hypothetical protein N805_02685 [Pseudomonas putida S13.1.2]
MDDQSSIAHVDGQAASDSDAASIIIEALRIEFKRLQREVCDCSDEREVEDARITRRAYEAIDNAIDCTLGTGKSFAYRKIITSIQQARLVLDALDHVCETVGLSPALQRQVRVWNDVLAYNMAELAALFILFAYSRHVALSIPLHADGPELCVYKHRLR